MSQNQINESVAPQQERHAPTWKGFIQTIAIVLVGVLVFTWVGGILREKTGDNHIMFRSSLKDTEWDVVFAGSSHMNNALYPMQIWEEHGFVTYNNAQSGQILPFSYYACKNVIEQYHPKVIVLDLYMLYHKNATGNDTWAHQSLDTISPLNRISASFRVVKPEKLKEFLVPMTLYHTRWKELKSADFNTSIPLLKGCAQNFNRDATLEGMSYELTPADVKKRPSDIPVEYLDKITKLCKDTGTELVLVTLPYLTSPDVDDKTHDMSSDEAYFNWAADYAAENDLLYVNYFHIREEIGFEWAEHLYNYSHMNYWGGEIITHHLGQYLSEHFDFQDRREDPAYEQWNKDLVQYKEQIQSKIEAAEAEEK